MPPLATTDYAGDNSEQDQCIIGIAVLLAGDQKTDAAVVLTIEASTPKVKVMNTKKQTRPEKRSTNQQLSRKPQPQQILDKAKADKVEMEEKLKDAKLVLKRSLNHYDICKFSIYPHTQALTLI